MKDCFEPLRGVILEQGVSEIEVLQGAIY